MSRYNLWQNTSIFAAANTLHEEALELDRGAFFGSIRHTLNHLYWGDRIWMSRFLDDVTKPREATIPNSVAEFDSWPQLCIARPQLDQVILNWASSLRQPQLDRELAWFSGALNKDVAKPLSVCVVHFFNHQTHHRGQVHAMLTAAGAKPDDTDLFVMPENV